MASLGFPCELCAHDDHEGGEPGPGCEACEGTGVEWWVRDYSAPETAALEAERDRYRKALEQIRDGVFSGNQAAAWAGAALSGKVESDG